MKKTKIISAVTVVIVLSFIVVIWTTLEYKGSPPPPQVKEAPSHPVKGKAPKPVAPPPSQVKEAPSHPVKGKAPKPVAPPPSQVKEAPSHPLKGKALKSVAPPPPNEDLNTVDRILEKMELGNIAFNAPESMNLHDTVIVHLVLGLSKPIDELKRMIEEEGAKEGAQIRVANRMEARLSGPNFAITAITPEEQAISESEVTEWKWEVKPNTEGRQYLHLTLSALLRVDGEPTQKAIKTFDKMIAVEVTWSQKVSSFFKKNWQWLWAAVLVPLVGWLWKRRRKKQDN